MNHISKLLSLIAILISLGACQYADNQIETTSEVTNDHLLYATVYQQKSAEIAALQQQAFNLAELRLNEYLSNYKGGKPLAIIVDVDETVLDNSPFEVKSIVENSDYPNYWDEWCELAIAKAIPGASEFLNYAASKGVETFYVTNRKIHLKEVTKKNLELRNFPIVNEDHLLLREEDRSKEPRRLKVLESHEIVMLMGDNLGDFHELFDAKKSTDRHIAVQDHKAEFGKRFIVLPNAMYGAWQNSLIDNPDGMSKAEKLQALKQALENF